jgi:NAD-dependent SIR2 family protein deacetylase
VKNCDCLVVIGTKLETGLSASIVTSCVKNDTLIIEINPEPCIEIGNTFTLECFAEDAVP